MEYLNNNQIGAPVPKLTINDKQTLVDVLEEFETWYRNPVNVKQDIQGILDNDLNNDQQAFLIKNHNLGLKKNIRKEIEAIDSKLYIQPIFNEEQKSNDYKVMKLSDIAIKQLESVKKQLKEIQYQDAIGVSFIWEKIKEKIQKDHIPVVGHSCLYDLTYWYSHFEGLLDKNYEVFKANIRDIFIGGIYDSKIISTYFEMDEKNLEDMLEDLQDDQDSFISFTDPKYNCMNIQEHTTGKDAYMTGHAFLQMTKNLDPTIVTKLLNVVQINPNVLYAYNFGSHIHDVAWNSNAWVVKLKDSVAKQLRIVKGKKKNKSKYIKFKL